MVELAHWSFFIYSPLAHRDIVHRRHGCMPAANYHMELAQLARSVPSHHPPTTLLYGFYRPDHSTPTTLHHGFCQPNLPVTLASTHESFSDPPSLTSQAPSKPSPQSIHALGSLKPKRSGPAELLHATRHFHLLAPESSSRPLHCFGRRTSGGGNGGCLLWSGSGRGW